MYMKCYRMRDQKKKNPECRYPVFILDFTNFAGFCTDVMKSIPAACRASQRTRVTRRDSGLDTACKIWTVSY